MREEDTVDNLTRVMVFSAEPLVAHGIRCLLESQPLTRLALSGDSTDSLMEMAARFQPDVFLMDCSGTVPLSFLSEFGAAFPDCKTIVLTSSFFQETVYQLKVCGVFTALRRSCTPDELLSVFHNATAPRVSSQEPIPAQSPDGGRSVELSRREGQMISLLAQGLKNKEIAQCLGISEGTVKVYLSRLFQKTGASDRFDLALQGLRNSAHLLGETPAAPGESEEKDAWRQVRHVPALRSVWLRRRPAAAAIARSATARVHTLSL
jgi:DNA-binding NarL/FixJ family response regulator